MWRACKEGLNSKICTFITEDNHESKKVKGNNKNVVDDELKYEDYKNVLLNRSYMRHETNRIQSKDYNIESYRINTISLSSYDDKRYILKEGFPKSNDHLPPDQPITDQMHRSPTNRPPTNKKFEDQKFYNKFKMDN